MNGRALRNAGIAAVGLLVLGFSCEPPKSKNPLSPPGSTLDARLVGVWSGHFGEGAEATLTILPRGGARFDLVLLGNDATKGAVVLAFEGFSSTIAGKSYWNLRAKSYGDDYAGTVQVADDYIFARWEIARSGALTVWQMDGDPASAAVQAGALEGTQAAGAAVLLSAPSEKLAAFVASPAGQKSFIHSGTFKRTGTRVPAPG